MKRYYKDTYVIYYWYDHLLLRRTGESEVVQKAIEEKDFDTFKKIFDKYPPYIAEDGTEEIYFPETAVMYDKVTEERVGEVDITTPEGFALIDTAEFECG